ncbi:hypothetical protein HMSSN139_63150 [Paenibacillus sp. HMSSN-139]|nr:hypothetical protein HMSSN139_63150 [Paenibacillus sp. HMSSN-139]
MKRKHGEFVQELFKHVPVLDSGARGATTTFVERGLGDVLLAWENEAWLSVQELGPDKFDIVYPSESILAEPPVAVVDKNVDAKGTREVAEAYLKYLYSEEGQKIAAEITTARRWTALRRNMPTSSRRSSCLRSRNSAAGLKRKRSISMTAASSARFTYRNNPNRP